MRRLWAYILLAFTSLVLVGVSFTPVLKNANSNIDYQSGREITFHIESKDESVEVNEEKLNEVAEIMKDRLANQNVTRYQIATEGNDKISITLSQDYDQLYTNIIQYMEFDGSFALTNSAGDFALADEFLLEDGKATLETYNNYPCITLPVNIESEEYKKVLEAANGEDAKAEQISTGSEDEDTVDAYYLYLWYGFKEEYISPDTDYASDSHIIIKFRIQDTGDGASQYFPDTDNRLFSVVNLDSNGDGTATYQEKKVAYDTANYYINLLNASKLDVEVKHVGSKYVPAWVEQTIGLGDTSYVALTPTLIATLCALVLVSILLVYFFRLGAVSVVTTTVASVFGGLGAMVLLTAEYTTISIFAFIAVAMASLISGIIYLTKLKDEAYRGRSLKKANSEGAKKALLPIVDVHVVLILLGVFGYLIGGAAMRTFAAITVLGGVISIILNTLGLKGLMWLATNATSLQGKYSAFGIDGEKVPDLINEEKPSYFGPYAEKDLTKAKMKVGIGGAVVLVATIVAMVVFGAVKGNIYAEPSSINNSKVYFETTLAETSEISDPKVKDILAKTYVYSGDGDATLTEEEKKTAKSISSFGIASVDSEDKTYVVTVGDDDITHYLTIVSLNNPVDESLHAYYEDTDAGILYLDDEGDGNYVTNIINNVISDHSILESVSVVSLKTVKVHTIGQPEALRIALSVLAGLGAASLYLLLRYRLSRGIVATLLAAGSGVISIGLLSLIHLPVIGGYTVVIAPLAVLFSLSLSILFMNKERELIAEDKNKDNSPENRKAIAIRATSLSYVSVTIVAVICTFIAIDFFGFGANTSALAFIALVITMLITVVVNPIVIAPLSSWLYGLFSKVSVRKPTAKKKKAKAHKVNKSAEPEEAIFIGIND